MDRKYLLKKDPEDGRDHVFMRLNFGQAIPPEVDLGPIFTSIFDQLNLGSCTANAGAAAQRFLEAKKAGLPYEAIEMLSRIYLYFKERQMEGTIPEDAGAYIRDCVKVLVNNGVCAEKVWPYIVANFATMPIPGADLDAQRHRATSYQRITSLSGYKHCLAEGYPVIFGIPIYESFESAEVARTGIVPMPRKGEQMLGGHAVLGVGYKDTGKGLFGRAKGRAKVLNSWGEDWGDHGFFYLDYDFITKYAWDMWTIR